MPRWAAATKRCSFTLTRHSLGQPSQRDRPCCRITSRRSSRQRLSLPPPREALHDPSPSPRRGLSHQSPLSPVSPSLPATRNRRRRPAPDFHRHPSPDNSIAAPYPFLLLPRNPDSPVTSAPHAPRHAQPLC